MIPTGLVCSKVSLSKNLINLSAWELTSRIEYRDAHPSGQLEYVEEEVQTGDKIPRWTMQCVISESDSPLPLLRSGEEVISFARKKDAKRHAARCAIEWLIGEKWMPDDGNVTFPKPKPKPPPQPPPPDTSAGGVSLVVGKDNGTPATQRIPAICARLKFQPPQYKLHPDPESHSFFSGWAEFPSGIDMPTQMGHVSNVYTRKAAKEAIAVNVLKRLLEIEAERGEQADKLLQSMQGTL